MWKFGCVFDSQSPYAPWSLNMLYAKMEFGITLQRQIDLLSKPWVYHYHAYRHPLLDETSSIEWNAGFLKKELPTWRKTSSWHLCLRLKSLWNKTNLPFSATFHHHHPVAVLMLAILRLTKAIASLKWLQRGASNKGSEETMEGMVLLLMDLLGNTLNDKKNTCSIQRV